MSATVTTSPEARRAETRDRWVAAFAAARRRTADTEPAWLTAMRDRAIARFETSGFPTARDEEWKFTDISPIARAALHPAPRTATLPAIASLAPYQLDATEAARLVFVNGHFAPSLSHLGGGAGWSARPFAAALAQDGALVESLLGTIVPAETGAFLALNDAFFADGAVIRAARGARIERPIHLVHVATGDGADPAAAFPRHLVVLEECAEARVVESYFGPADSVYAQFSVTEASIGPNARFHHDKLQIEGLRAFHAGALAVRQQRSSFFGSLSLSVGAAIARYDISTVFAEEGAECSLDGLYMVGARQLVDHHTTIDHATPHGTSREFYKGVLDGKSRAVFNGKIVVRPDAQKTDARQTNRNLVLSDDAGVNSKPQLEIFANDVKCAHGATVGQIDADALHYLRARGIERDLARGLLTYAFAAEILDGIGDDAVRDRVRHVLTSLLPGGERLAEAH